METVLLGSFLTQYDAIQASFKEMKPFLIMNETGSYYHRLIFSLKVLFLIYAFDKAVEKHFSVILRQARNFCGAYINPVFSEILPRIFSIFVIIFLYKGLCTSISAEFITDIFILIFSINYAVEAYKREFQKISSIIFMCLFVHWYINHNASTEKFRFRTYFKILALLFLSYLPMMPNNRKYRHRLAYFYILICVWILYQLVQHYDGHHYVMHQNKTRGAKEHERLIELDPERGKLVDTLQNLDINNENICSDTENVERSCYTLQKVVPKKPMFPSNEEHIVNEKLEWVPKCTSFSDSIQNEYCRNTAESDTSDVKEVRKGDGNSESRPETLNVHDIEQYQPNVSTNVVESKKQTEDAVLKLPKIVHTDVDSASDRTNSVHSKFSDDEMHKNILMTSESKEINAQSEKTPFEEAPKTRFESTTEAPNKENDATGIGSKSAVITKADEVAVSHVETSKDIKTVYRKDEMSESSDADLKPEGKKNLNGKRKILIFKRHGEVSKIDTSKVKANGIRRKVEGNDGAIQKKMNSKNESLVIFGGGKQSSAGINPTKITRLNYRKVSSVKIERKDRTGLQIKNSRAGQSGSLIKPEKVRTFNSVKKLLSSKPIVKRHDRKKDLFAIGDDSPDRKI